MLRDAVRQAMGIESLRSTINLHIARQDRRYWQGIGFIVTAAVIWVLASFVVQEVEDEGLSPFLLSYIANSLFIVYLPIDKLRSSGSLAKGKWRRLLGDEVESPEGERLEEPTCAQQQPHPQKGLSRVREYFDEEILRAALVVAPLWFLAQFTFNASLHLTSVTSNTILSSTASLFTYGLSWALVGEPFVPHKLVSILVCAAGTSIVTLADSKDAQHPGSAAGDALCVLSAVFYACYTVAIKKMLRGDEETNMILFFGYVGLINLLGLAPVLIALQVASLINVAQLTAGMFFLVVAKGLLDNVLSDYLWARAVLLVGPTVATVGMSVQVPMAVFLDIVWKRPDYIHNTGTVLLMLLGGWYVLTGFVGINIEPKKANKVHPELPIEDATLPPEEF